MDNLTFLPTGTFGFKYCPCPCPCLCAYACEGTTNPIPEPIFSPIPCNPAPAFGALMTFLPSVIRNMLTLARSSSDLMSSETLCGEKRCEVRAAFELRDACA